LLVLLEILVHKITHGASPTATAAGGAAATLASMWKDYRVLLTIMGGFGSADGNRQGLCCNKFDFGIEILLMYCPIA